VQRADGFFKNPMVGFTESLEHLSFGGNHHSKPDESIAQPNRSIAFIRN
jgi:hypothetical protein